MQTYSPRQGSKARKKDCRLLVRDSPFLGAALRAIRRSGSARTACDERPNLSRWVYFVRIEKKARRRFGGRPVPLCKNRPPLRAGQALLRCASDGVGKDQELRQELMNHPALLILINARLTNCKSSNTLAPPLPRTFQESVRRRIPQSLNCHALQGGASGPWHRLVHRLLMKTRHSNEHGSAGMPEINASGFPGHSRSARAFLSRRLVSESFMNLSRRYGFL